MADDIDDIGKRHGFGAEATRAAAEALRRGGGRMAQFSHPQLGGMGQWSAGGMVMIGEMSNHALKARVDALCRDLADVVANAPAASPKPASSASDRPDQTSTGHWWPWEIGTPTATGAQNAMRYACFPDQRRLAVMRDGKVKVYETGDHRINGFSQQQGGGQTLTFTSQTGTVRLDELREI